MTVNISRYWLSRRTRYRKLASGGLLCASYCRPLVTGQGQFDDTVQLAVMLLDDDQDLIHKAVGWMLREVGNRDKRTELRFLDANAPAMPRTMLRYREVPAAGA